jgi:hypothetical protein
METLRVLERADFIGIDFDGCHQQTLKPSRRRPAAVSRHRR